MRKSARPPSTARRLLHVVTRGKHETKCAFCRKCPLPYHRSKRRHRLARFDRRMSPQSSSKTSIGQANAPGPLAALACAGGHQCPPDHLLIAGCVARADIRQKKKDGHKTSIGQANAPGGWEAGRLPPEPVRIMIFPGISIEAPIRNTQVSKCLRVKALQY
jgi:hypothetical protein